MKRIIMVGNTHFDPVWLWRWDEAMASISATFRSALDRMNENENFCYSFSAPAVFEWIENTDPDMFLCKGRLLPGCLPAALHEPGKILYLSPYCLVSSFLNDFCYYIKHFYKCISVFRCDFFCLNAHGYVCIFCEDLMEVSF